MRFTKSEKFKLARLLKSPKDLARLYRYACDAGSAYAAYGDDAGDSVEAVVKAAEDDGWEVEVRADHSGGLTTLKNGDGELLTIGGDARGLDASAVVVSDWLSIFEAEDA